MNGGGGGPAAVFYERYQNLGQLLTQSKRFYPIISKTKGVAPKIKLLVYHVTRRDILPPPFGAQLLYCDFLYLGKHLFEKIHEN